MAIVISGCPRSGTSLLMDCMRQCVGEDRIIGNKFPQEQKLLLSQHESEDDNAFNTRSFLHNKFNAEAIAKKQKDLELIKDMNPNGFFEGRYAVQGIQYHIGFNLDPKSIVKVVSQGLPHTDPIYVDKMIYMLREPHQVAKSQERLRRMTFVGIEEERKLEVHTPEMFINVTYQGALWLRANPSVDVLFVDFDDLVGKPDGEFARIKEFLGEGDFTNHPVEPKLKRSEVKHKPHRLWKIAERMYECMGNQDYDSVIECYKTHIKDINRDKIKTHCLRLDETMVLGQCHSCILSKACRTNFRKTADAREIDWKNQPCIFKCMTEPDVDEHESMEDSVKNNSWGDTV